MSAHDTVRPLLALSAAGLLEAAEERLVRNHAAECAECAVELDALADLAASLAMLPVPAPAPDLVVRTQVRVAEDRDRRQSQWLAIGAAVCGATATAGLCLLSEPYLGSMVWVAATLLPTLPAAGAVALLAGRNRVARRSL